MGDVCVCARKSKCVCVRAWTRQPPIAFTFETMVGVQQTALGIARHPKDPPLLVFEGVPQERGLQRGHPGGGVA